jgi:AraC-like DNA-binding protein
MRFHNPKRCVLPQYPVTVATVASDARTGGLAPWRIRRLLAFVEEHLSQSIHIEDLSRVVGLSVPHFSRAFGVSFGKTPHVYVIQRRLDRSRDLMLASNMMLSEIALACGFNDQAHFCRLFSRYVGTTPAAWRRACHGEAQAAGSSLALHQVTVDSHSLASRSSAAAP